MAAPKLIKITACLVYEILTILAIVFVSASFFLWLAGDATSGIRRLLLQLFLWLALGAYFVWCWYKSGQTLAMQAWKFKLVNHDHQLLSLRAATLRYILATFGLSLCGLGFLWAIVDRQHLFLHDRLLKNILVTVK